MTQKGDKLCDILKEEYISGDKSVQVSASIGIASAPVDGEDFLTIYRRRIRRCICQSVPARTGTICFSTVLQTSSRVDFKRLKKEMSEGGAHED